MGMVSVPQGHLYFTDGQDRRVVRFAPDGAVGTLVGATAGEVSGPGADARLNAPSDLCLAADGRLFVADQGNHCIRVVEFGTPRESTMPVSGVVGSPAAIAPVPDAAGIVSVSPSPRP